MTEEEVKHRIDNKLCLMCRKPISEDYKCFCENCNERIERYLKGKDWFWLVFLLGVFSEQILNETVEKGE